MPTLRKGDMRKMQVWIIHDIEICRYDETVVFYGVATNEAERDRIMSSNKGSVATEIKTDCDHLGEYGAQNFHESPNW